MELCRYTKQLYEKCDGHYTLVQTVCKAPFLWPGCKVRFYCNCKTEFLVVFLLNHYDRKVRGMCSYGGASYVLLGGGDRCVDLYC